VDEPQASEPAEGLSKVAAALTPGDRDSTFAGGGLSTYPVSGVSAVTVDSTLLQPDGKIVVSGMLTIPGTGCQAYVSRFTSNGVPDSTFGGGSGMAKLQVSNGPNCHGAAVALLPDGKFILATTSENSAVSPATSDYVLVRLNANGSQDYAFNAIFYNVSDVDRAVDVKVTSAGVIVLGGWSRLSTGNDFIIARFSSTGSMLSVERFDFQGGNDVLNRITLQPDGKILAVGKTSASTGYTDFALARFTSAGAVDTMFGSGGGKRLDAFGHNDVALSVAIQGDGKILVGGSAYHPNSSTTLLALFRLNATGTAFDTTFGDSGQAYANPGGLGRGTTSQALVIQADGKIVSAGNSLYGGSQDVSLVRFTPGGTLDSTFLGGGGFCFEPSPNSADSTSGVLLQTGGKLLVAGTSSTALRLSRHVP
jgi:uncharacterized delta-60 repeat protein